MTTNGEDVYMQFEIDRKLPRAIQQAMRGSSTITEAAAITQKYISTWRAGDSEAHILFGEEYEQKKAASIDLFATLSIIPTPTPPNRPYDFSDPSFEFRIWYGPVASITKKHVDSCGQNLLVSVHGQCSRSRIQELVTAFKDARYDGNRLIYKEFIIENSLSNDVRVYAAEKEMKTLISQLEERIKENK